MKTLHLYYESFNVAHEAAHLPFLHAHEMSVQIASLLDCQVEAKSLLEEFHDRPVNDMIPGGAANPENLAAYIHERLTGFLVQAISVWFDDIGVRLEW